MYGNRIYAGKFTWMYYPAKTKTNKAIIVSLGDSDRDNLVKAAAKYLNKAGCNVLAIAPIGRDLEYSGWHNFPLETYEQAAKWLLAHGNKKVGVTGGSTTGMLSLLAAAYIPDISLVLAYTPSDFLMQGFYIGKKDGYIPEWPAKNQSCATWRGKPVPYSPFNMSDEDYYNTTYGAALRAHREIYSLPLFRHMEKQPGFEHGLMSIENIKAKIVVFGAEDDTLWDTCKYIRRMKKRLDTKESKAEFEAHIYKRGTHFIFPQGMLKEAMPFGGDLAVRLFVGIAFKSGRKYPKECEKTRKDVEKATIRAIKSW